MGLPLCPQGSSKGSTHPLFTWSRKANPAPSQGPEPLGAQRAEGPVPSAPMPLADVSPVPTSSASPFSAPRSGASGESDYGPVNS